MGPLTLSIRTAEEPLTGEGSRRSYPYETRRRGHHLEKELGT